MKELMTQIDIMNNIPLYVPIFFILTYVLTLFLYYLSSNKEIKPIAIIIVWSIFQSVLCLNGFYNDLYTFPPKFALLIIPSIIFIIFLFLKQKNYIDKLSIDKLHLLHLIRVPIEIILYWLFLFGGVPIEMTFEGRNFDILAGLTAPIIYYFGFVKTNKLNKKLLIIWNIISLLLLFNIVVNAILSSPTKIQLFAFDHPNIAVFYFPFCLLPSIIVPLVLFSHLVSIRGLSRDNN